MAQGYSVAVVSNFNGRIGAGSDAAGFMSVLPALLTRRLRQKAEGCLRQHDREIFFRIAGKALQCFLQLLENLVSIALVVLFDSFELSCRGLGRCLLPF